MEIIPPTYLTRELYLKSASSWHHVNVLVMPSLLESCRAGTQSLATGSAAVLLTTVPVWPLISFMGVYPLPVVTGTLHTEPVRASEHTPETFAPTCMAWLLLPSPGLACFHCDPVPRRVSQVALLISCAWWLWEHGFNILTIWKAWLCVSCGVSFIGCVACMMFVPFLPCCLWLFLALQ